MKKVIMTAALLACAGVMTAQAEAQSIRGTMGVTARAGFISPADSKGRVGDYVDTNLGFVGDLGFIYGVDDNLGFEVDLSYGKFSTDSSSGYGTGTLKGMAVGMQYRFPPANPRLTPYMGLGVDVLIPDYKRANVDTVFGAHVRGGFDYFVDRNLAVNIDLKVTGGFEADVDGGGKFDTSNVTTMGGFRYFFR